MGNTLPNPLPITLLALDEVVSHLELARTEATLWDGQDGARRRTWAGEEVVMSERVSRQNWYNVVEWHDGFWERSGTLKWIVAKEQNRGEKNEVQEGDDSLRVVDDDS
ncbi:hypothetical protein BJ165DRAFT_1405521 [Panaeolus papilionaceus]|nr:hypothetical protein BJ165DRAFT_1405521 [Panaeolus papilionaceus]